MSLRKYYINTNTHVCTNPHTFSWKAMETRHAATAGFWLAVGTCLVWFKNKESKTSMLNFTSALYMGTTILTFMSWIGSSKFARTIDCCKAVKHKMFYGVSTAKILQPGYLVLHHLQPQQNDDDDVRPPLKRDYRCSSTCTS